jgi:hypothetical protein
VTKRSTDQYHSRSVEREINGDPIGWAARSIGHGPQVLQYTLISEFAECEAAHRYYGVKKHSSAMIIKWQKELSADDQCRILEIARSVPIGRLFDEVDQDDAAILPGWTLEGALYKNSPAGARCVP